MGFVGNCAVSVRIYIYVISHRPFQDIAKVTSLPKSSLNQLFCKALLLFSTSAALTAIVGFTGACQVSVRACKHVTSLRSSLNLVTVVSPHQPFLEPLLSGQCNFFLNCSGSDGFTGVYAGLCGIVRSVLGPVNMLLLLTLSTTLLNITSLH